METVGGKIRQLRQNNGFTQETIADSLGVTRQAVAKWECGQTAPSTANLLKLAELFSVSLQELTNINVDTANVQEYVLRKKKEEEAHSLLLEQVKRILSSVLWQILSYASLSLLCWIGFHLFGIPDYVWAWVEKHYALCLAGCVSVISVLCGYPRFSWVLFIGVALGVICGNVAGKLTTESSFLRFNDGWMIFLLCCGIAAVVGLVYEIRTKKKAYPSLALLSKKAQKVLTAALVAFMIVVSLVSCYASVNRLSFNRAAEKGYQSGLEKGVEDAQAGKQMNGNYRESYLPKKYAFGSAAYKGFSNYWSSGYTAGYSMGGRRTDKCKFESLGLLAGHRYSNKVKYFIL